MVKYGYTIVYVVLVEKTLEFYKNAFGRAYDFLAVDDNRYKKVHSSRTYLPNTYA